MVWRLRLALSRLGSCEPLGQHRIRRRRQGLQAQDCHQRNFYQEWNRLRSPQCRYKEFFHDQVQERSDHQVVNRNQVVRLRSRNEVFDLLRQQGSEDIRNRGKICLRHFHRQFQVQLGRLQPFFFYPFNHLQQAVHGDLQQAFNLNFQQIRQQLFR